MTGDTDCAFEMPIRESAMRAYLQRYPFAIGPDPEMNARCLEAIRKNFAIRKSANGLPIRRGADATVRLMPHETTLSAEMLARVYALMDQADLPKECRDYLINDFGWEAKLIPSGATDVLVVGCGNGMELLFLRAALPDASLTAVDYADSLTPQVKTATGVRFLGGDMNEILETLDRKFDLVSSNHTLEHMYSPDQMIATLSGLLREDGALISTLPMDAVEGSPFLDKVTEIARNGEVHPIDVVYLDAGHPWKTNPADLQATFLSAGFAKVDLYQRAEHLSRPVAATQAKFHGRKKLGLKLHALFFGAPRAIAKALSKAPPAIVVRALLAAERRTWFGANMLKNLYTQEVCVVAYKQP
jgi:2-polyprenyl-3-methyl-5-hydroxy-6-metoxy-1,4-benzoquinol methylase